eukprot:g56540.t1
MCLSTIGKSQVQWCTQKVDSKVNVSGHSVLGIFLRKTVRRKRMLGSPYATPLGDHQCRRLEDARLCRSVYAGLDDGPRAVNSLGDDSEFFVFRPAYVFLTSKHLSVGKMEVRFNS